MDLLVHLRRSAAAYPDKLAVADGDSRFSWSEFDQRTRRLAAALADLGIKQGDRVGVLMYNGFRYLEAFYAIPRLGAVIVPLNIRYSAAELAYVLNDCQAVALLVDNAFAALVEKAKPDLTTVRHFIFSEGQTPASGPLNYETLVESSPNSIQFKDVQADEDDLLGLFYTGGTTGRSKGVMLTHKNLASNALHAALHVEARPHNVYLHTAPMFHLADVQAIFVFTLVGGCHTFLPKFDAVQVLEIIQRERVTHIGVVPTLINLLIQVPNIKDYDLSSLEVIWFGGSIIPAEVLKRAREVLPCRLMPAYGLTEAAPGMTFMDWGELVKALEAEPGSSEAQRLLSCGQPMMNVAVRVVNEDGEDLPPGELGEIIARGPNIMKGYWNLPGETENALRDGWLYTGDLGTFDERNFLYIIDRKKDMIKTGGENVFSAEVENALYSHPAVLEAAAIAIPDPQWGERVHAVIVLKPDQKATAEEIMAKCRELIGGYKIPRSIEFVEEMPKSGAGKILKRLLREKYWQNQSRQIN